MLLANPGISVRREGNARSLRLKSALLAATALALLAAGARPAAAQFERTIRSTSDARQLRAGRVDQPFWRETQSHRGWEIREPQYTVFANTSLKDARWAAGEVQQAWTSAAKFADRWTDLHRQPDFGLGSTQVVIDSEPPRERDRPLTTLNVVGIQTQIYLNVAPGQPTLQQQVLRLRGAAAFAMLHTAGLDAAAPPWVVQGLAANLAEQGLDSQQVQDTQDDKLTARFGGQQWRYTRSAQDTLADPGLDESSTMSPVKFLLTGDDAAHAPALLANIRAAWEQAQRNAAEGGQFRRQPGEGQPAPTDTTFDRLLADLRPQYETWQQDPLAGQPLFEPEASLAPEVLEAQREMLVLLKLQRKLALQAQAGGPRPRVTTFDRAQGRQVVVDGGRPITPASFSEFAERLRDRTATPIATLDVDGSLLLSSDAQRMEELLDGPGERYSFGKRGEQIVLIRYLAVGSTLQGWLDDNPRQPARPLAKFELVGTRVRTKSQARPAVQEARAR